MLYYEIISHILAYIKIIWSLVAHYTASVASRIMFHQRPYNFYIRQNMGYNFFIKQDQVRLLARSAKVTREAHHLERAALGV